MQGIGIGGMLGGLRERLAEIGEESEHRDSHLANEREKMVRRVSECMRV